MGFISVATWRDLTDGHLYHEGDRFPFDGREVPADRTDALENGRNRAGLRLIRKVESEPEDQATTEVKAPEKASTKVKAPEKATTARKTASAKEPEKKAAARARKGK